MGKYLNETGRPILYSCEWAIYARAKGVKVGRCVTFLMIIGIHFLVSPVMHYIFQSYLIIRKK